MEKFSVFRCFQGIGLLGRAMLCLVFNETLPGSPGSPCSPVAKQSAEGSPSGQDGPSIYIRTKHVH